MDRAGASPAETGTLPLPELAADALYATLGTGAAGLSGAEAAARRQRFGPNAIVELPGRPLLLRLLANFTHLMALLLWAGGLVGFLAHLPELGVAIWAVNLINGTFSFWQEYRAERATVALRRLLPRYARVRRDGQEIQIPATDLVSGDLVLLAEGDSVSADARLVQAADLRVDESTLTGESRPVRKSSEALAGAGMPRLEAPNLVFAGTSVVSGTGMAVAFATGMRTEFGRIARLTQGLSDEPSPLQQEMSRVTRLIAALAVGIGTVFFALSVLQAGVDPATGFVFAMGMIVAFVPEGMLPTVTLSLAMGVQRMARRQALVKQLSAVETLGCTTVICTDKTGTLTENEMTVEDIWLVGRPLTVTGVGYAPEGEVRDEHGRVPCPATGDLRRLLVAAALCNNAHLVPPHPDHPQWEVMGDPTEAALRVVALKAGVDPATEEKAAPRVQELPFDSRRKRMSTLHADGAGLVAYVKGAPTEMLALCHRVQRDGSSLPLDATTRAEIAAAIDSYAAGALRVLGVATRTLPAAPEASTVEAVECELTFLGLLSLMDPARPEVPAAVERCHRAGIRVIMITGDYGLTAESIARRIGIVRGIHPRMVTGAELAAMTEPELRQALVDEVVFARVSPEDKLRVVQALQALGHVVAVTGDGVNDAPALKAANIGVAMGVVGTDVAREAADVVLGDDNFATIVNAVEEGRAVYANIRKFAVYVFNSNLAEAVPFVAMLFSRGAIPLPLTVMQVLAIDLGTDMVPAIGLGAEPPEAGVMTQPPRDRQAPLLDRRLLARALLWYGLIESVAALSAYFFLNLEHGWPGVPLAAAGTELYRMATTMTFAGVVATQVGAVFGCRTERISVWKLGLTTNRLVLLGVGVELALLALLVHVPFLQRIFGTSPLGWREWAFVFAWAPAILLADEARKALRRRWERRLARAGRPSWRTG